MKTTIVLFLAFIFFSNPQQLTVDTYDWSNYHKKSQAISEALSKVITANIFLKDDYNVDFDALPQRTKVQLAILQDAAYLEWLVAEEALGKAEAAKYWIRSKASEESNLKCYEMFEREYVKIVPQSYSNVAVCRSPTRTECHLKELKKLISLNKTFHKCTMERYGKDIFTFTKDPVIVNH